MSVLVSRLIYIRDYLQKNIGLFESYFGKLEFLGFSGYEPYLSKEIKSNLIYIKESTILSQFIAKPSKKFNKIFIVYGEISHITKLLKRIMDIYNKNQFKLSKEGSRSSSGSTITVAYLKNVVDSYQILIMIEQDYKMMAESIELIQDIIEYIGHDNLLMTIDKIDEINDIYYKYVKSNIGDNVIKLYSRLLHEIILINSNNKEVVKHINKTTEILKSEVLKSDDKTLNFKQNYKVNTVQNLIQMNNLIPVSMSMPISDIYKILGISVSEKSLELGLKKASKLLKSDKNFGFIVINKIIKKPIEYNFWSLSDKKYLETNNLLQAYDLGLNEKSIKRYQTITPLPESIGKDDISDKILIINSEFGNTDNYFYILETLDGINYRFLTMYNGSIYYMPAEWFKNIDDKKLTPSNRLESYNNIICQEIMTTINDPYITMDILDKNEIKEELYWKKLRYKIKEDIMKDFTELITDKIIQKMNITDIENILFDKQLYRFALNHITNNIELESMNKLTEKKSEIIDRARIELTLSYFYDINSIQRSLRKDVENIYRKEYYNKVLSITNSSIFVLKNKLTEIFDHILNEVLEKFVNRKSGIYLSIQKKFDLLTKTLLS